MTIPKPTIAVDVDGVLADLHVEWLRRYNRDYNDDLKYEQITEWGLNKLVKPECGKGIFKYLSQPDLYEFIPPIKDSQTGVKSLRTMGWRVVYATSCVRGMADQKWEWLEKWGFLETGPLSHDDLVILHDKALINADSLIDDHFGNFKDWTRHGILLSAPYNLGSPIPVNLDRAYGWVQIVEYAARKIGRLAP